MSSSLFFRMNILLKSLCFSTEPHLHIAYNNNTFLRNDKEKIMSYYDMWEWKIPNERHDLPINVERIVLMCGFIELMPSSTYNEYNTL